MKTVSKKLTAFAVCLLMLASAVIYPSVLIADADEYDYQKAGFDNSLDYLLDRDGFVFGIDYDGTSDVSKWGNSLCKRNYVTNRGGVYNSYITYHDIYNMRALGFNAMDLWFGVQMEGLIFDEEGVCTGTEQEYLDNIRDILNICRELDMKMVPHLRPHTLPDTFSDRGEMWGKLCRFMWPGEEQDAYIRFGIEPTLELLAQYQDVVIAVGITIENGNSYVNDPDMGYLVCSGTSSGTSWENYSSFVNRMCDTVKRYMPNTPTENEEVGGSDKVYRMARDTKIDLLGQDYYHSGAGNDQKAYHFGKTSGFIGEYNIGEDGVSDFGTYYWGQVKKKFIPQSMKNGWLGAFYFCYKTGGHNFSMMDTNNSLEYEKYFNWALEFRYTIDEQINRYRGVTPAVSTPVLLANKGSAYAYWIASIGVEYYTLERSTDGGKTFTLVQDNITPDEFITDNGLIKCEDKGISAGQEFCHRVTAHGENGATSVSKMNNTEEFFVPYDVMTNGGFETGTLENWGDYGKITQEKVHSGEYAMKLDTTDGAEIPYAYCSQIVPVKPNTTYTLTFYYIKVLQELLDPDNRESSFSRAFSLKTGNLAVQYHWGVEQEDGWFRESYTFSTGDEDQVRIDFNVGAKKNLLMYFDDVTVMETR